MFLPLILIGVFSEFTDIGYDDMLGSTPVGWPEQWAPAMVAGDSNHFDTITELYIYFGVNSKYDLASGFVEAYIADGDDSLDCDIDYYGIGDVTDYQITCDVSSYTFAAGTYGPIHFVVRESDGGQVLAEDTAFAYFALIDAQPTEEENTLTVEFDTTDFVVSADATLSFSFALAAGENLYRGDYFVLSLDDSFTFDTLTIALNESTNAVAFPDDGAAVDDDDGNLYLIGLTEDLSGDDNANFTFTLSGFSNPSVVTSGSGYYWSLKVWRYGAPTLLKWVSGTGPSDDVVAGSVSVSSWAPVHTAIKTSNMYSGMVTYMTLTLSADHDIPASGKVVIVANGVKLCSKTYKSAANQDINAAGTCGVVADSVFTTAAVSGDATLTLTVGDTAIKAKTSFKVINLVEISSATIGITSVTTGDGTDDIDTWDSAFADISLTGTAFAVDDIGIYTSKTSKTGKNTVGTTGTHGIGLYFTSPVAISSAAYTITIYIPIIKGVSTFQTNNIGFPTNFKAQIGSADSIALSASLTDVTGVTTITPSTSIAIKNPAVAVAAVGDEVYAYISGGAAGDESIFLPGLVTFLKNTPQVVVTLAVTSGLTYAYSAPWYITDSSSLAAATFTLLCADVYAAGMPAKISITPDYNFDFSGYTLLINLAFTNLAFTDFGTIASLDPISALGADNDEADVVDATHIEFTISKITTSGLTITLPIPAISATDATVAVTISVVDSDDVETVLTTESAVSATTTDTGKSITNSAVTLTATDTDPTSVSFTFTPSAATYNWVIFYEGTDFTFTSPTMTAGDYQIYTGKTTATAVSTTFSAVVTNPWYDNTVSQVVYFAAASGDSYASADCAYYKSNTYTYATGTAATVGTATYTPAKSNSYTFAKETVDITLTLPITGYVYRGAEISIVLGSSWTNDGVWTVTLGGTTLSGSSTSGTWTTTSAIDFESSKNPSLIVKVEGLDLPEMASTDADAAWIGFTSASINYDQGTDITWTQSTDDTGSKVVTTIAGVDNNAYTISDDSAWIYPDLKGSVDVYFGISFSTKIDLASGDEINIDASFSDDTDVETNTWCSLGFDSVSLSSGVLTVTLNQDLAAGDVITIIKDLALTPSATGDQTVTVTVSRDSTDFVSDTTKYSVIAQTVDVTSFTVTTSNSLPGFSSIHTFTVKLDTALDAGSCLLFDASSDYNIALGDVYNFEDYGDEMFLWAEDGYFYSVSHWVLEYVALESYDADTEIVFEVELDNPSASGSWSVYVTDVNMTFTGTQALASDLTFDSSISNDIDVYFATPTFSSDSQTHSLSVEAFVTVSATADSTLLVMFPAPYNLDFDNSDSVTCSLTLGDADVSLSTSSCPVSDNVVTFTLSAAQEFTDASWTTFTIEELVTPKTSLYMNMTDYQYDDYSYWTGKFCVAYGEKDADVSSISFDNLNGAYFGFEIVYVSTFLVNDGEVIVITPGTYSGTFSIVPVNYEDGKLSDSNDLLTENVTLTAKVGSYEVDGTIALSDDGVYVLDFFNPSAEFWVGAPADCPEGMYYIVWTVDETPYDSFDKVYGTYLKTKLQVSSYYTYDISVDIPSGSSFFIPVSGISLPYKVSISQDPRSVSPYDTVTFTFEANSDNVTITFFPEGGLVLNAFETEGYIYASCDGCVDGDTFDIMVSASDNAAAFVFNDFSVVAGSAYDAAAVFTLEVPDSSLGSSGFEAVISSDSWAVVTWCLISLELYNETLVAYDYLINNTYTFGSSDYEKWDFEEYVADYLSQVDDAWNAYDTYEEVSIELLKLARSVFFIGQSLIEDTDSQSLYDFTGLLAFESDYSVFAYVDNYYGGDIPSSYVDVTTSSALKPYSLGLSGDLDSSKISVQLSQLLNMNTQQILFDDGSRRRLSDATVTLISGVSDQKSAGQRVSDVGVSTIASSLGVTVTDLGELSASDSADWEYGPVWDEVENGVVTMNYTTSVDGYVYCVLEVNSSLTSEYSSDNIRFGLNRNGDDADDNSRTASVTGESMLLTFNYTENGYGVYDIACVSCDSYPLTPTCSAVSNYTLDYSQSSSSAAVALVFAVAAYLLI